MAELKTDYKDDVLDASVNEKRLFNIVSKDGIVLFENVWLQDVTAYTQNGDTFGAADINRITKEVNRKFSSEDVKDPMEVSESGYAADALAVKNGLEAVASMGDQVTYEWDESTATLNIVSKTVEQ